MSHDAVSPTPTDTPPPVPFTDEEKGSLRADDVKAGWTIGTLTVSIFLVGVVIYLCVLIWTLLSTPNYSVR